MGRTFSRVRQAVSGAPGTGNITLGAATATNLRTFAQAGAINNQPVTYLVEEGTVAEIHVGAYSTTGPTLTRSASTLLWSSSGSLNTLTSAAIVSSIADGNDVNPSIPGLQSGAYRVPLPVPTGVSAITPTPGTGFFRFFDNPDHTRIQEYGTRSASSGTGQVALALYASGPNGFPIGAPLHGGALFTPTYSFTLGGYSGIDVVLPRGRIWFAVCLPTGSTASLQQAGGTTGNEEWRKNFNLPSALMGSVSSNQDGGLSKTGMTAGTWPTMSDSYAADFTGGCNITDVPCLYLRGF